MPESCCF